MTNIVRHNSNKMPVDEALNLLSYSSPELQLLWQAEKDSYDNYEKDRLDYDDISCFTKYIVSNCKKDLDKSPIKIFFAAMEEILQNGDEDLINLMEVGIIEGIQNISSWDVELDIDAIILPILGKRTTNSWNKINDFWNGKS